MGEAVAWKAIPGFEGKYEIGTNGTVRYIRAGHHRPLKPKYNRHNGYMSACLVRGGGEKPKYQYIHRLVAEAFIPNPDNLPTVNHKDECKTNNDVSNLEWCTQAYNNDYSKSRRWKRVVAKGPDGEVMATFESERFAASIIGVGKATISNAISRGSCCRGLLLELEDE